MKQYAVAMSWRKRRWWKLVADFHLEVKIVTARSKEEAWGVVAQDAPKGALWAITEIPDPKPQPD